MLRDESLPSGVVLDEPQAKALLYAAVQEKLLDDEPLIGDGFVGGLLRNPPSQRLISDSFEQLILGGRVLVPFWIPEEWKGELFEKGLVVSARSEMDDELIEVPELPTEIILGMLDTRGIHWSETDLFEKFRRFKDAYEIWDRNKGEKSYDGFEIRRVMHRTGLIKDFDYTAEEISRWEKLQNEYREFNPAHKIIEAYSRVLTCSIQNSALSSLPTFHANEQSISLGNVEDSSERQVLLKVTCEELRRVPIDKKLSETMRLAQSPEAASLRTKLAEWTDALRNGEPNSYERILNDISYARKELSYAKSFSKAGQYSTWVGVTALGVAALLPPLGTAIGAAATVTCALALAGEKAIKFRNRWAMFGQD
jgi:hypothetical protein